jgi:dTDP-4-dehydrorhamnose reductase
MASSNKNMLVIGGHNGWLGHEIVTAARESGSFGRVVPSTSKLDASGEDVMYFDFFNESADSSVLDPFDIVVFAAHVEKHADEAKVARCMRWLADAVSGKKFVYVSSDGVFDGLRPGGMYTEDDPVSPRTVYGRNLVACEAVVENIPGNLIIRPSYMFGRRDGILDSRLRRAVGLARDGREQRYFTDMFKSPYPFGYVATMIVLLLETGLEGVFHVAGERMSIHDFYVRSLSALGEDVSLVVPATMPPENERPDHFLPDTSLDSSKLFRVLGLNHEMLVQNDCFEAELSSE